MHVAQPEGEQQNLAHIQFRPAPFLLLASKQSLGHDFSFPALDQEMADIFFTQHSNNPLEPASPSESPATPLAATTDLGDSVLIAWFAGQFQQGLDKEATKLSTELKQHLQNWAIGWKLLNKKLMKQST